MVFEFSFLHLSVIKYTPFHWKFQVRCARGYNADYILLRAYVSFLNFQYSLGSRGEQGVWYTLYIYNLDFVFHLLDVGDIQNFFQSPVTRAGTRNLFDYIR